jgi:hypothetical protein
MIGIQRDQIHCAPAWRRSALRKSEAKVFQRLDGGMDISEQAQPREDETGLEGPDLYED